MRSAVAVVLFCATSAFAQPYLVKDLNTTGPISGSSYAGGGVTVGSSFYFTSSGHDTRGLYRLDRLASAPVQVIKGTIMAMTPFRGRLLVALGNGLAITDGTPESVTTFSDATINSGPMLETTGRVVFARSGGELWSTDGTSAGTAKIDFHPPTNGAPNPTLLGTFGGRVVFVSNYGVGITDGTAAGTTILTASLTDAGKIVVSGDRFFFAGFRYYAYDGGLWVSDGTPAGTRVPKTSFSYALPNKSDPIAAIGGNRVVYWPSNYSGKAMWVTDGTDAGTAGVVNVYNARRIVAVLNGIVYFPGSETNNNDDTLWRTDGTAAGTRAVATLPDGYLSGISSALGRIWMTSSETVNGIRSAHFSFSNGTSIRVLAATDASQPVSESFGRVYFSGFDAAHGYELWSSDGTPEGTGMVVDVEPNIASSSYATPIAATATRVLFTAIDNSNLTRTWSSDGTAEGTQPFPFTIFRSLRFGDFVYFTPEDKRADLYRTDGTPEGTQLIHSFAAYADPVIATNNLLYINSGHSIWATDGTPEGTSLVAEYGILYSDALNLAEHVVYRDGFGTLYELIGRQKPRVIMYGISGSKIVAGGRMFFLPSNSTATTLLVTDGTADGIRLLATFPPQSVAFPLGAAGDRLLFAADDGVHGLELWSSDGTPGGTALVRDIRPGSQRSIIGNDDATAAFNGRVLFTADDGTFGPHLWSSDGTAAGTVMLPANTTREIVVAKGLAFFEATDLEHGTELWQTDGTVDGTRLVGDIYAGPSSSAPAYVMATRDLLFFQATTLETGAELWASPLPGRTIAIDDARAPNGATTATITVSLDAPSTQPVSATWSSTTGASGAIAFAPGETTKTIAFAITPDLTTRLNRFDSVRLSAVRGAVATKSFATVIEEAPARSADLSLSIGANASDDRDRSIIVTNHGPDTVPEATITYRTSSVTRAFTAPVSNVAPGTSVSVPFEIDGIVLATVSSPTGDPDPTNNSLPMVGAVDWNAGLSISVAPAVVLSGAHATLTIGSRSVPVSLASSDPSVIAVPATARSGDIDVVALAPGHTTLTASVGSLTRSIEVGVVAAGATYRWPSQITMTIDGDPSFGAPLYFSAKIPAWAWDVNAGPTGPVTFYDGDNVLAVAYVNRSFIADTIVDSLLPGPHTIKAVYAGDAHFFGTTAAAQTITIGKPEPVTFYGTYDPRSGTTAEITIVVVTPHARPATGTITLKNGQEPLVADVPLVDGIARVVTNPTNFVTVFYSGDDLYEPAIVSVTLSAVRHRAAP